LSDKVTVVVTRASYARRGEVLTIAAHLENRSSERVAGPFILRAHTVQAELGDPVAINADNGVRGAGAEWLFSSAALPPSGMSGERVMTFALANLRPFREGRLYRLGVLELSAGVYPRR
jgi:hypothetical protein